ncbi:MAG TPA: hypothetical protein GXZ21_03055 [Clostridiales bacterium]|nr:hypothetical protein [Clostridiales bacterium]
MIDAMLAKRFIERISQFVSYNVNIMDEKGIIIASKNKSRIGTYHEIAMQIIHGDEDTIIVDKEIPQYGVKKGVNMAIYHKKRKEGVVGITGNPADASELLHIHRNTLVYRLNKIRDLMNVDPINNNSDREFLNGFYYYLKRKEKIYKD